jgi:sugar phosphate isomerase/epimerase
MNISIASYAFYGLLAEGRIDIFGYLESCKYRYGMDTADIWNGMFPSIEPEFLKKVKEGLAERELTLVNLCVDGPHIWEDDQAAREKNYKDALAYMKVADYLGAKTLRMDAGGQGETFSNEQFDLIVKRYKEYAKIASDHGFKVGPETHWGPEVVPANMLRICQAVDHPAFGVLMHFHDREGENLIYPYTMHTHIMWDICVNRLEENMNMLRQAGYTGCWGVEHHTGKDEYPEVAVQVALVRAQLEKWASE